MSEIALGKLKISFKNLIVILLALNILSGFSGYFIGRKEQILIQQAVLEKIPDLNHCFE